MEKEMNRLSTFGNCPSSFKVSTLARNGFYYTGNGGKIKCHYCRITLENVQSYSDVENRHQLNSPKCKYILGNCTVVSSSEERLRCERDSNYTNGDMLPTLAGRKSMYKTGEPFNETLQSVARREKKALETANLAVTSSRSKSDNESSPKDDYRGTKDRRLDEAALDQDLQSLAVGKAESGVQEEVVRTAPYNNCNNNSNNNCSKVQPLQYTDMQQQRNLSVQDAQNYHVNTLSDFEFNMAGKLKWFLCDGGLKNFPTIDDAWKERARWFLSCAFLRARTSPAIAGQQLPAQADVRGNVNNDIARSEQVTGEPSGIHPQKLKFAVETQENKDMIEIDNCLDQIKLTIEEELTTLQWRLRTLENTISSASLLLNDMIALEGINPLATYADGQAATSQNPKKKSKRNAEVPAISNIEEAALYTDDDETRTLLHENHALREMIFCKVCMDTRADMIFLPCQHLSCCWTCAELLKNCNFCGSIIRDTIRAIVT